MAPAESADPFSLYIHIPFCGQRCPYCDFNTYVEARIPEEAYTQAAITELAVRSELPAWKGRAMQSIFFGGGTPSLFSPDSLGRIISAARERFSASREIEISIEANPGTVDVEYFTALRDTGVARLSIGAQSFSADSLRQLGRAHSVDETINAVSAARSAGYDNINLDLIYALPDQTVADFESDLAVLKQLAPEHISAYQLTIEKGTPFSFRYQQGELKLPPEEDTIVMMETLARILAADGYEHYEISNFAKPALGCRHNQAYWDGDDYLGIGAGAHSFSSREGVGFGRRWSNYALPAEYMRRAGEGGLAESWSDSLSKDSLRFEFFFLGLRRTKGVSIPEYRKKFGEELINSHHDALQFLFDQQLLARTGDLIFLTERGRLLSDSVFEHFTSTSG